MRRKLFAVMVVLGATGLTAAPAQATFHLKKVNELLLASATGDAGVQFVELLDKGGSEEAFTPVFAPYKLVVFDGAGSKLGEQTLDPTGGTVRNGHYGTTFEPPGHRGLASSGGIAATAAGRRRGVLAAHGETACAGVDSQAP